MSSLRARLAPLALVAATIIGALVVTAAPPATAATVRPDATVSGVVYGGRPFKFWWVACAISAVPAPSCSPEPTPTSVIEVTFADVSGGRPPIVLTLPRPGSGALLRVTAGGRLQDHRRPDVGEHRAPGVRLDRRSSRSPAGGHAARCGPPRRGVERIVHLPTPAGIELDAADHPRRLAVRLGLVAPRRRPGGPDPHRSARRLRPARRPARGATFQRESRPGRFAGAHARDADFRTATFDETDFTDADLTGATFAAPSPNSYFDSSVVIVHHTTCPDGTNSSAHGETCRGHGIDLGRYAEAIS